MTFDDYNITSQGAQKHFDCKGHEAPNHVTVTTLAFGATVPAHKKRDVIQEPDPETLFTSGALVEGAW